MANYKRLFLEEYNYIFFTLVTYNRQPILINNIELLKKSIKIAKSKYKFEIIAIVVLKDHLHFILKVENTKDYPKIIYQIKYNFSKILPKNKNIEESKVKKGEKGIWQRRYWEHTIRNLNDLNKHLDYIHYNPIKHEYVETARDWKYSSFKNFVKENYYDEDWCNFKDTNNIKNLNFE